MVGIHERTARQRIQSNQIARKHAEISFFDIASVFRRAERRADTQMDSVDQAADDCVSKNVSKRRSVENGTFYLRTLLFFLF